MSNVEDKSPNALTVLRRFARPRNRPKEQCELCGTALGPAHDHLIEPVNHQLHCACQACALLFADSRAARYRRVVRRVERMPGFQMSDYSWERLLIPINLAFFFRDSHTGRVLAMYPSPAGATESLLELESWQELSAANPVLDELLPDVEALLVNRMGESRDYYRASIDVCYELVGTIRMHWRGISGGAGARDAIRTFFEDLKCD